MRKSILFMAFLFCISMLKAQSTDHSSIEGDILMLGEPSGASYTAIKFPRKNIIIKRGAIANFNSLLGKKLVVEKIETNSDGMEISTLRRKDGLNFFRFFPEVKADLSKAIESGELKIVK
ncbi:MAG: hypothetical protein KJP26_07535 [Maribacter sp.]|nr:hypothetical protein [Maribacter sp.]